MYRSYLEKIIPDLEKEHAHPGQPSNLNAAAPEHHHGPLGLLGLPQLSTATSSRPDVSRLGPYMPADIGIATVGKSTRHARRREEGEGPWLADLSRQYTPPQQTPAQPTPRISSLSYLPRIRVGDSAERPQRLAPDASWTFSSSEKSLATLPPSSHSSLLSTSGHHPHAAFGSHDQDFARVKHEPEADSSMPPPLRTGTSTSWTYVTHHPPSAPHTSVPFFFVYFSRRVLNCDMSLSLGGKPAAPLFEEIVIMRAPFEMTTQAHLDSAICTGLLRETTQPLPFMDQVELGNATPPSEIIAKRLSSAP